MKYLHLNFMRIAVNATQTSNLSFRKNFQKKNYSNNLKDEVCC